MFGFKKEETYNPVIKGLDDTTCTLINLSSKFQDAVRWVEGQLETGREFAAQYRAALRAMDLNSRAGERNQQEINGLRTVNEKLRAENTVLRDALYQACKDNEAIDAELDELYDDAAVLCDLLDEADEQAEFYEGVIAAMLDSVKPQAAKKGKKK
jgi:hypothetical protein